MRIGTMKAQFAKKRSGEDTSIGPTSLTFLQKIMDNFRLLSESKERWLYTFKI